MVNKTLMSRLVALERAERGAGGLDGMLTYNDCTETPLIAVERASGPGLYFLAPDSLDVGYLCEINAKGRATVFGHEGREVALW
ncbi:hypothetical protein [Variovorax sp. dw_308]|uniref:hypothetical protein n=1 Tax=Variovorax sp. dw_308 TaxID=2721546 RepID=UPI001C457D48|nr:hypothetical protein [Variovorax sp. dw_308]